MSPARIAYTAHRVLEQIRHDPRTVALMLVVPSLLIGLVAWIFSETGAFTHIGPAMIALFPFVVMFLVTSIATLRERRGGTLERLLAMPLAKPDFILGYALAFTLVAIVQTALAVVFAVWVCGLEIAGSLGLLFTIAALDALLGTSLGLMASAFARTEFQVVQFMPAIILPQFLLSGIVLPRQSLPPVLEAISDWLPLSHAIDALVAVAAGTEDSQTTNSILIIAAWIIAALLVGSLTLRRRTA